MAREDLRDILGGAVRLFDEEVRVVARALGVDRGDFFDEEILRALLDLAPDRCEITREERAQVGQRFGGVVHSSVCACSRTGSST